MSTIDLNEVMRQTRQWAWDMERWWLYKTPEQRVTRGAVCACELIERDDGPRGCTMEDINRAVATLMDPAVGGDNFEWLRFGQPSWRDFYLPGELTREPRDLMCHHVTTMEELAEAYAKEQETLDPPYSPHVEVSDAQFTPDERRGIRQRMRDLKKFMRFVLPIDTGANDPGAPSRATLQPIYQAYPYFDGDGVLYGEKKPALALGNAEYTAEWTGHELPSRSGEYVTVTGLIFEHPELGIKQRLQVESRTIHRDDTWTPTYTLHLEWND